MDANKFNIKYFVIITLITSIWINISEIFRYDVFVVPKMKSFFDNKEGVVGMNLKIFAIWGFWDTLLTAILVFIFWLYSRTFGNSLSSIFTASTLVWLSVFVIFWIATANMGLADWNMLWIALPLSWIEMFVGAFIASKLYKKLENEELKNSIYSN